MTNSDPLGLRADQARRAEQLERLLRAHAHMPREMSIAIILGWMDVKQIDRMLKAQERTRT